MREDLAENEEWTAEVRDSKGNALIGAACADKAQALTAADYYHEHYPGKQIVIYPRGRREDAIIIIEQEPPSPFYLRLKKCRR